MAANLYVGNLPYRMTNEELAELFAGYGEVVSAKVVMDRETGRSRGFGFVEMGAEDQAQKAIDNLNQQDCQGRMLKVNLARPREERPRSEAPGQRGPER
ncbi:MAG: RNA-binding protein [Candidatus Eisenbacteria bacterium]|nr:RNA-binding protein [Candidatus Eisenbacteria bacterium]